MSTPEKIVQLLIAVSLFFGVMGLILVATQRLRSRRGEYIQTAAFVAPSLLMIAIGLLYPAINTIIQSFQNAGGTDWVGFDNYQQIFTNSDLLKVLRTVPSYQSLIDDASREWGRGR